MCCWSGEASFALATCGFAGAYVAAQHKHPVWRWAPLAYFSTMEALQGFTYIWIGQCGATPNEVLTTLSYLHIAGQPWLINMFMLSFQPEAKRKAWWIWASCALASVVMLAMWLVPGWPGHCDVAGQTLCGPMTCSYHGNWHIAWMLKLSNLDPHYVCYGLAAFVMPFFYGAWRIVVYHLLCGPLLMFLLTSNKDEQPAVWCLLSIALLLATHIPGLNRWLAGQTKEL
jgi:hypothetical protein